MIKIEDGYIIVESTNQETFVDYTGDLCYVVTTTKYKVNLETGLLEETI